MNKSVFFAVLVSIGSFFSTCCEDVTIPKGVLVASGLSADVVAKFVLFIAIILLWTVALGKIFKIIFRIPVIAGQIIGGILLGPSCVNIANFSIFASPIIFIEEATNQIYAVVASDIFVFFVVLLSSGLTVSYLLWIAGHETDIRDILKVGITATTAGIFGALFPIILTVLTIYYFCS